MKAAVVTAYGRPEVLEIQEMSKPLPKANEILIKIHATTVTSGDARLRRADPPIIRLIYGFNRPRIGVLGSEFAGVIEAVGSEVKSYSIGDAVFGSTGLKLGANAEYICLAEGDAFVLKPANLSFAEAAAISFGATTALFFLRDKGQIQAGHQVLINGASGSLGTAAVQLAKYFGAEVTAVCSARNFALVQSLGADQVIDYTTTDFTQNGKTYDLIFEAVGKRSFADCKRSLNPQGKFLAAAGGLVDFGYTFLTSLRNALPGIKAGKSVKTGVAMERKEDIIFLKDLIEAGHFKAVVDQRYPFVEMAEAHDYVDQGHKRGNVVVTI